MEFKVWSSKYGAQSMELKVWSSKYGAQSSVFGIERSLISPLGGQCLVFGENWLIRTSFSPEI